VDWDLESEMSVDVMLDGPEMGWIVKSKSKFEFDGFDDVDDVER